MQARSRGLTRRALRGLLKNLGAYFLWKKEADIFLASEAYTVLYCPRSVMRRHSTRLALWNGLSEKRLKGARVRKKRVQPEGRRQRVMHGHL